MRVLGITLLALFATFSTFGAQNTSEEVVTKKKKRVRPQELVYDSYSNRDGQKMMATLGTGASNGAVGSILNLGYYLDPDKILILGYSEDSLGEDDYENIKNVELAVRFFTGNSFYFQVGAYYQDFKDRVSGTSTNYINGSFSTESYEIVNTTKSLGADIRIGNQWQWENFTIGCSWIGLGKRLKVLSEDIQRNFSYTRNDEIVATLLNLYVGVSF